MRAEFRIGDASAEYTFYYADSEEELPVHGGTGAQAQVVEVTENTSDYTVTVKDVKSGEYYGVLKQEKDGVTYYSRVMKADADEQATDDFTYLTLAGRTSKMSLAGTGYSFGEYYGVADQPFGEDPFTGRLWGYENGYDHRTEEYHSDEFLGSARYATEGNVSKEIKYKYEVDFSVEYTVTVLFLDPWNISDRKMSIDVNGTKKTVTGTNKLTAVHIENVKGQRESGKLYITVNITASEGAGELPAVNLIAIQTAEQAEKVFGVEPVQTVVLEQGQLIADVLPKSVNLITSKGTVSTDDVVYTAADYTNGLEKGGGNVSVQGVADGKFPFTFSVATEDPSEDTYYYIDAGAMDPSTELAEKFELFRLTNPNLINDALDKYASADGWGRLGSASDYVEYWANYPEAMESVVEGKYPSEEPLGFKSVQYRLTGLPAGKYSVVVGVDVKTWGSRNRGIVVKMGDTELGTQADYNGPNEWTYPYEKTDAEPVVFKLYSIGTANPVLAYLIVKKEAEAGAPLSAPLLPAGISAVTTELTVRNTNTAGALLVLTDDSGRLIAEHLVTGAEADAGCVELSGLDLSGSDGLQAVLYKDGVVSGTTVAEFSTFALTAPRTEWSADPDVISVIPSGSNIKSIDYRDGEDGEWIGIKTKKFFRAPHNGTYYVRLVTTEGVETVKTVEVDHVDTVEMQVENDLTAWVDAEYILTLDFARSPREIVSVKISDGETERDITSTGTDKKFTYSVASEGTFTVTAKSDLGTTRTFEITGCRFETIPANLSYELCLQDGVYALEFSSESVGGVEYSYSLDGGEFQALYRTSVPLVKEGSYVYKSTNKAGKSATVNIVYAASFRQGAPISVSVERGDEEDRYSFTFLDGLENISLVRLDGAGGKIDIENNVAVITASGYYAVTAQKGDTLYITSVFVNREKTDEEGEDTGAIIGLAVATGIALIGFLGASVALWRKRR